MSSAAAGQTGLRPAQADRAQAVQLLRSFARSKRTWGFASLWLFGLAAMFALPAPVPLTEACAALHTLSLALQSLDCEGMQASLGAFDAKLQEAEALQKSQGREANRRWQDAQLATYNEKSWFWWFKPEARARVNKAKARESAAAATARQLNRQHERLLSDAKSELGLWSEVGVDEARKSFWRSFEAGKVRAQPLCQHDM